MSDEIKLGRNLYQECEDLKKRIEELEKWKGIINKDHQKAVIDIDKLEKKVDLLDMEKKLKIDYMLKMNQLVKNDKTHQALYDKIFKEIAELRDLVSKMGIKVDFTSQESGHTLKEIFELKEAFKKREEHQFMDYFKLQRFEEVLRELIDVMRKHLIIDHDHESTDVLEEESELVKLLAKLSGETEKKEDKIFTINELTERIINSEVVLWKFFKMKYDLAKKYGNGDIYKFYGELLTSLEVEKQDSGGEKVRSAAHTLKPKMTDDEIMRFNEELMAKVNKREVQPLDDSKPPEPKHIRCEDCWFDLCARRIEGFGCNKGRLKKPREDDVIHVREMVKTLTNKEWVLVKREDLQFLYEYSYPEGVFDDDLIDEFYAEKKRIKEEYSL